MKTVMIVMTCTTHERGKCDKLCVVDMDLLGLSYYTHLKKKSIRDGMNVYILGIPRLW